MRKLQDARDISNIFVERGGCTCTLLKFMDEELDKKEPFMIA